ncbi:Fasciclin-like arabinogalactan protein 19 [Acorus calamus]|uniref:Fasciclin-like arabinogalactan protein 19 n=1 Tax=Acorus calamus TaxID=4465 RepID=A0AAV9DH34_ACOCL|nr:Fasciclin-like arabinogalactan protein 19 [Acorus calamus]
MAKILPLLILYLTLSNSLTPLTSISHTDFDQMLSALRSNGYNLICNAISASDIRLRLLSSNSSAFGGGGSFTLFAPTDSSLFALDMASASASDYVRSLRLHVALRRLSSDDLRSVSAASSVPTLLHGHHISLSLQEGDPGEVSVAVDGVKVVRLGILEGPGVAVHGLEGILSPRRVSDPPTPTLAPESYAPAGDDVPIGSDSPMLPALRGMVVSGGVSPPAESPVRWPGGAPAGAPVARVRRFLGGEGCTDSSWERSGCADVARGDSVHVITRRGWPRPRQHFRVEEEDSVRNDRTCERAFT